MNFPSEFFAGDTLTWRDKATRDSLGNQLTSDTWTLTYALRGAINLTLTASADSTGWITTATSTQTATLTAGTYYWQAYVTSGSQRITLGSGQTIVKPNLSTQAIGYDGRSQNQIDLDAITAEISARVSGGASIEYTIGNRSLKKEPMSSLIAMQNRLKYLVMKEQRAAKIANGLGDPRAVFVRF